jgi:hypothetical protein
MLRFAIPGLLLLGASCSEISFKEPQPHGIKSLSKIPERLHGSYQIEQNGGSSGVMEVFAKGYRIIKADPNDEPEEYLLSDSLVLKYYKGYYFVNVRDESVWILRVIQREKNGNLVMMELPSVSESEERRKQQLEELSKIVPVITTEMDGTVKYIMEPTPRQLIKLIRKGYFKEQTRLLKR